mgnify:CR=1 FL=1
MFHVSTVNIRRYKRVWGFVPDSPATPVMSVLLHNTDVTRVVLANNDIKTTNPGSKVLWIGCFKYVLKVQIRL